MQADVKTPPEAPERTLRNIISLLTDIWKDTLELQQVSPSDDFFDLGGTSLKAVSMLDAVETRTGRRLPASTLLQHGTIEALARKIADTPGSQSWSSAVVLNGKGDRIPIVAVHGAGDVLYYAKLADALGDDQPVLALQAPQEEEGKQYTSMEEIAAAYIEDLKSARPGGPYILAGHCIGSYIALEMAQQLRRAGERVDTLVFFDTAPEMPRRFAKRLKRARRRIYRLASHVKKRLSLRPLGTGVATTPASASSDKAAYDLSRKEGSTRKQVYDSLRKHYQARRFPGRVLFVQSTGFANRPGKEWHVRKAKRIAGKGFELVRVPGDHLDQFHHPNVGVMAERLRETLDKDSL